MIMNILLMILILVLCVLVCLWACTMDTALPPTTYDEGDTARIVDAYIRVCATHTDDWS
jgi:hypothetical protein